MSKKHGGKREGAGKPALYGEPMKRVNMMLDSDTIKLFKELGGSNVSKGARKAAEQLRAADESITLATCQCFKPNIRFIYDRKWCHACERPLAS